MASHQQMTKKKKLDECRRQELHDHRKYLLNLAKEYDEQRSKQIVWLAGAGLALCVNIIAVLESPMCAWLLKAAAVSFTVAIIAALLSHGAAQGVIETQVKGIDKFLATNEEESPLPNNSWTDCLNWISLLAIISGIIASVTFLWVQMPGMK